MIPRYPDIQVTLDGCNGTVILYRCEVAARHHVTTRQLERFMKEAKSGDHNHLLLTCRKWFNCD